MELDAPQDAPCLSRFKGFVEGSGRMGVEVVLHDADVVRMRIDRIDQPANALSVVDLGAVIGHFDMAPAGNGSTKKNRLAVPNRSYS